MMASGRGIAPFLPGLASGKLPTCQKTILLLCTHHIQKFSKGPVDIKLKRGEGDGKERRREEEKERKRERERERTSWEEKMERYRGIIRKEGMGFGLDPNTLCIYVY